MKHALVIVTLCMVGCVSAAKKLNGVSMGMSKLQVIDVMGDPDSTKAQNGKEFLVYMLASNARSDLIAKMEEYWVVLDQGRVVSYGKAGDFGTAQDPTNRIILEDRRSPSGR